MKTKYITYKINTLFYNNSLIVVNKMLIGLISDTHIPDRANKIPKKVIETFNEVDLILHAGDITDPEVIKELEKISPTIAVEGNMDRYSDLTLPKSKVIKVENTKIGIIHGEVYPRGDLQQLFYLARQLNVNILVSGHSHIASIDSVEDVLLVNPGSPTSPRLSDPSVMLMELKDGNVDIEVVKVGNPTCNALNYFKNERGD